jgi:superfamily II DNA or RNA helicase
MPHIKASNQITISGLDVKLVNTIKKAMTIPNPLFFLMKNIGKRTWIKPEFYYFRIDKVSGDLIIPRGSLIKLKNFLYKNKVEYTIETDLVSVPLHWKTELGENIKPIELREYQKSIVSNIADNKPSEGVISMTTGSGKTLTSLAIIQRLGLTATILLPNNTLLNQWHDEIKKQWNYDAGIVNGEQQIMRGITLATYQTLDNRPEHLKYLTENASILIIEEAQGVVSAQRMKIVNKFRPSYLYGLSGTPERTDKQTKAIFFYCGDIVEEYVGELLTPSVELVNTKANLPMRLNYHEMVDDMVENASRNKLIYFLLLGEILQKRKILVLTKRKIHYEKIREQMSVEIKDCYYIDSDNKDRFQLLGELKEGARNFNVIFGTTALLSVGTDIPSLDTIIIACDMKSSVLTTQSVGRILRLFAGKQNPKIIDLRDIDNPVFRKQAFERERLYKLKGWIKE